jgi:thiol-disulfide isomerase/thioredoxin
MTDRNQATNCPNCKRLFSTPQGLGMHLKHGCSLLDKKSFTLDKQQDQDHELLTAVQKAYRKHCLNDNSIGWEELDNILLNALCNSMGDKGYQQWMEDIKNDRP